MASAPEPPRERLFFALWPPADVARRLRDLQQGVLRDVPGRRIAADRLHLTLRFVGGTDTGTAACLRAMAAGLRVPPFTLVVDCVGAFPRAKVVWAGVSRPPDELAALAAALEAGCRDCGVAPETRPFVPHLTLLRKATRRLPKPGTPVEPVTWPVTEFVLAASQTRPEGAVYRVRDRWPLRAADG